MSVHDNWKIPAAAPLPPIQEDPAAPATPVPSRPATPRNPPSPMDIVRSPGQRSNASEMSLDPPPSPQGEAQASELYDVPDGTLATWGYQINRRLEALVCISCKSVVTPTTAINHHHVHEEARVAVNQTVLEDIVRQGFVKPGWPSINPGDLEYEGLERKWGVKCPQCPAMYAYGQGVVKHVWKVHHERIVAQGLHTDWMQRLSQHDATHHGWLSCVPRSVQLTSPSANYLTALRKELDARPPIPAAERDHRHISPWHATTRWLEYIDGRDPQEMLNLIKPPEDGQPFFYLIACVRNYVERAYDLIATTSDVCLQILHTDTDTSDFNHQPFARHQAEGTLRAYERLVVQLLLFLLRAGQDMDLPPDVKAALQALRHGLQGDMDDAGQAIHQLLLMLWMREWTPTVDNLFPDPTVCFVIHTQVNQDGSLKKPESVTGIFAKLVYDMRLTFLYECHQRLSWEDHPATLTQSAHDLRPWFTVGRESTFHSLKSLQHRASSIT
ncbi:hypothetical protein VTO73DRAFT_6213, partial [Trametes versicolor]